MSEHRNDWKFDPSQGTVKEEQHETRDSLPALEYEPPSKKPRLNPMKGKKNKNKGGGKGQGGQGGVATGATFQRKRICKKWNDNRGCKGGQRTAQTRLCVHVRRAQIEWSSLRLEKSQPLGPCKCSLGCTSFGCGCRARSW